MAEARRACFHCGEPVPAGSPFELVLDGVRQPLCCGGCQAVAELIRGAGFGRYYQFREGLSRKPGDDEDALAAAWASVDDRQALWGAPLGDGRFELVLQTEGIHCAACAWLIRSGLSGKPGIEELQVDTASGFTVITWRPDLTRLSQIAQELLRLGYKPHLPIAAAAERARREERRASLKRMGVAGLGMMQVMMYAVGLYAGDAQGIDVAPQRFLQWVSLLVTTPVLLFSGRVFIEGALRGLRAMRPGMDLPVALAMVGAYVASCVNFFRGSGEVWFDSVVMFIFFLSIARHVEMSLRHRNQQAGAVLARLLPEWAERLEDGLSTTVATTELCTGDHVRVRGGEAFPADAEIIEGRTEANEALLTGESHPVPKVVGDAVLAGSINLGQAVSVRVTATGPDSSVSHLGRLLQRARATRVDRGGLADRYASLFVLVVLLIAVGTAAWWLHFDPGRALGVTLAVLVVSCPCAFSLATPAVVAAASRALLRRGVILTRGTALEALADVKRVIFDKTGTLTAGAPRIEGITVNPARPELDAAECTRIAAALEQHSAHPTSAAFRGTGVETSARDVAELQGRGLLGHVGGRRYWIGSRAWVSGAAVVELPEGATGVWLADEAGWLACFELADGLRDGARELVQALQAEGLGLEILSGDNADAVQEVADVLGIQSWEAGLSPDDKLACLADSADAGANALMVGDGVNDAPVLAAAGVSISVHSGTELANSVSDYILTGRSLAGVDTALRVARRARRIVRQNLLWAAAYNGVMIPLAVSGILQPWMAAAGMSASSLLVVLNASRITNTP